MDFTDAIVPAIWQFALFLAGLGVAIAQHLALRREPTVTTLPAWQAKPQHVVLFLALIIFCFPGVGTICGETAKWISVTTGKPINILYLISVMQAMMLGILLLSIKFLPAAFPPEINAPEQLRSKNWLSPKNLFGVPAFFALGVFTVVAAGLFVKGLIQFFPEDIQALFGENQQLVDALFNSKGIAPILVCLPALTIITPISEEIIFRFGLYRLFKYKMPPLAAAIVSSAIFALMHDSYASYLPLTLLGCIFCYAYEKTGRLAAPILIHALFNANTLLCIALVNLFK